MSKRNKGQSMMYQGQAARTKKNTPGKARPAGRSVDTPKRTGGTPGGSANRVGKDAQTGKSGAGNGIARVYERPANTNRSASPDNILKARIAAGVIAVLALAGGLYWIFNARGSYSSGMIIGLVALGFLAGLMIFAAMRAEFVLSRLARVVRR